MKSLSSRTKGYGPLRWIFPLIVGLAVLFSCGPTSAGRFVTLTETAAFPRGEGEVVQTTAFSTGGNRTSLDYALELQVGVEYGLVDRLQVGFALPNVATSWTRDQRTTEVGGTALWGLYNIVDLEEKGWGLSCAAIFVESPIDRRGEMAFLVEKPLDDWIVVYNGTVGRSWARINEFGAAEAMTHSLGTSYKATNSLFLGLEGGWYLEHVAGSPWETASRYLGPNLSVDTGRLWITAAAHFAVGSGDFIPDQIFQVHVGLPF